MDSGCVLLWVLLSNKVNVIFVNLEFCTAIYRLSVEWAHLFGLEVLHDTVDAESVLAWQLAGLSHQTQTN